MLAFFTKVEACGQNGGIMDIDLSIGSISAEIPEAINVLVDRTGFNNSSISLWKSALRGSGFPDATGLAALVLEPTSETVDESHNLILRAGRHASDSDADGILTYAYATGSRGAILFGAHMVAVWRDEQWWMFTEDPAGVAVESIASILGDAHTLLIGLSDDISALADWGLEDWYPDGGTDLSAWIEGSSGGIPDPDGIIALPPNHASLPIYLAYAWGVPTLGPPSPDAASTYHRTRLTALKLATEGYFVTVDWGPFTQSYEWAMENPNSPRGEVFIDTRSGECASDACGHLPNVAIGADSPVTLEIAVAQVAAMEASP